MAIEEKRLILKYADQPGYTNDIDCYIQHGGYEDLKKAFKNEAQDICQEVLDSVCSRTWGSRLSCRNEMEVFGS